MRVARIFLLSCLVLSVVSISSPTEAHAFGRIWKKWFPPKPKPTPTPSPGPVRSPFDVGVAIHLDTSAQVGDMAEMGAKWVRIDMNWSIMERTEGVFDFGIFDLTIQNAKRYGLKVFASIGYSPPWASASGEEGGVPQKEKWMNFVRTAVLRYQGQVDAFGIWNEPNLSQFWSGTPEQWVDIILKPACSVIRTYAPGVKILGPELAHLYSADPGVWFLALKNRGATSCIDIVTHHIYSKGGPGMQAYLTGIPAELLPVKFGLKQWMQIGGLWGKDVWITEFGYDVKRSTPEQRAEAEATQAVDVPAQLKVMYAQPWVKKAFIFEMTDGPNPEENPYEYGILRYGGERRPVFDTVKSLLDSGQIR